MLLDLENELTTKGGQLFNAADGASEYGDKTFDAKAANDLAIGEPLHVMCRVEGANSDVGTSLAIALVGDTDGAGTSEVTLVTKTVLQAALLENSVFHIGIVPPGVSKRYLRAKVTTAGAPATVGKLVIWLAKGSDMQRANVAGVF